MSEKVTVLVDGKTLEFPTKQDAHIFFEWAFSQKQSAPFERESKKAVERPRRRAVDLVLANYSLDIEDLPEEEWKDVEGYTGYQVSTMGRVKSFRKNNPKIMKPAMNNAGSLRVRLCDPDKYHMIYRLVANAFLPQEDRGKHVHFIDGNRHNVTVENLRYE